MNQSAGPFWVSMLLRVICMLSFRAGGGEDDDQREREEHAGAGEGGRDLFGERRAGGGEHRHEDADADRSAEVVEDVDEAAGDARVVGSTPAMPAVVRLLNPSP